MRIVIPTCLSLAVSGHCIVLPFVIPIISVSNIDLAINKRNFKLIPDWFSQPWLYMLFICMIKLYVIHKYMQNFYPCLDQMNIAHE